MSTNHKYTRRMYLEAQYHGFSPIPVVGKEPFLNKWSTMSGEEVLPHLKSHDGNIAIRTGQLSDVIIIDCDKPRGGNGEDGNDVWERLVFKHEKIKASELKTAIDKSGSGGYRYYFKWKNMSYAKNIYIDAIKTLIDILADGQCAVYPGSVYPGCYTGIKKIVNNVTNVNLRAKNANLKATSMSGFESRTKASYRSHIGWKN